MLSVSLSVSIVYLVQQLFVRPGLTSVIITFSFVKQLLQLHDIITCLDKTTFLPSEYKTLNAEYN